MSHIEVETTKPQRTVEEILNGPDDELLSEQDIALATGRSVTTIRNWRYRAIGPKFVVESTNSISYRRGAYKAWLKEREVTSTAEAKALRSKMAKRPKKDAADA